MRIDTLSVITALAAGLLASAADAKPNPNPNPNPPTLHGFCASNSCADNGTNTPTSTNPPQFGFNASGKSAQGIVTIDILVPDNDTLPASYTISGPFLGSSTFKATEFSTTAWTSGGLDSYLGISASPADKITAFLPSTQALDPGAKGFFVFTANIGTVTLPKSPSDTDLMTTDKSLLVGSYIVAFINQQGVYGTNANSGAILETGLAVPEPATWAMMLAGFGLVGAMLRRRTRLAAA